LGLGFSSLADVIAGAFFCLFGQFYLALGMNPISNYLDQHHQALDGNVKSHFLARVFIEN